MYLGIDIGTSSVKAVMMDAAGILVDQASAPLTVSRPQALWSEQDPADWWSAVCSAVGGFGRELRQQVRGIGLSGQMHGATLLDRQMRVLRPAILWNDGRSSSQCRALEEAVPNLRLITGNLAMPGFTAPKLMWVQQHEPDTFRQTAMVLLPKDYVRLCMTGDTASDMSDSAGTLWMDVAGRRWSQAMLAATSLGESNMPVLLEGNEISGRLRAEVAEHWGMPRIPVVAGGGDNAAGAIGVGVVRSGEAFLSLGTSGVLFLANDGYRPNAQGGVHTFCHALPNQWHQMSVILSAASCVEWVGRIFGLGDVAEVVRLAAERNQPSDSEIFLPYLSGERTPHNDPHAKGVLFGLTQDSSSAHIAQAVLEGIAFAFRDGMDALTDAGSRIDSISVIGGGSRSKYWGRILSSALRRPLIYRDGSAVGPAYGAARLALMGIDGKSAQHVCTPPPALHVAEPDEELADLYDARLTTYRSLYSSLKKIFLEKIR